MFLSYSLGPGVEILKRKTLLIMKSLCLDLTEKMNITAILWSKATKRLIFKKKMIMADEKGLVYNNVNQSSRSASEDGYVIYVAY